MDDGETPKETAPTLGSTAANRTSRAVLRRFTPHKRFPAIKSVRNVVAKAFIWRLVEMVDNGFTQKQDRSET
jgi:hypothetical protein